MWSEDFSASTLEDVLQSKAENRAWSKELRRLTASLVNNRLAKQITQDDYLDRRKATDADVAECRRRSDILDAQIRRAAGVSTAHHY